MIAIIDYDVGNLKNVDTALTSIGLDSVITRDPAVVDRAEAVILPGVGAFKDAMTHLETFNLIPCLEKTVRSGKPLMGICLGMQVLFDQSHEDGLWKGLGFIPGEVVRFSQPGLKIPHMGWNNLVVHHPEDPLVKTITSDDYVYFVHSYYAVPQDFDQTVIAYADYSVRVPGIVRKDNVIGMQFHPEKSGSVGAQLLMNFKEILK